MNLNPQHRKLISMISKKRSMPADKFLFLLLLDEYERTFNKQYPVWCQLISPVRRHDWCKRTPTRWSLLCDDAYVLGGNLPLRRGWRMWRICWIYWIEHRCWGSRCCCIGSGESTTNNRRCIGRGECRWWSRSANQFTRSVCKKFVSDFYWYALLRKPL